MQAHSGWRERRQRAFPQRSVRARLLGASPVQRAVAERYAVQNRHRGEDPADPGGDGRRLRIDCVAGAKLSQDDSPNAAQTTGQVEVGQHAIDAEARLADILQAEDRAGERGPPRRAERGDEQGEAAPEERALGRR